ncbi:MAG: hypothetical protein QXP27_01870, partial [Candidatus Methanomethyliaceae archaeon]
AAGPRALPHCRTAPGDALFLRGGGTGLVPPGDALGRSGYGPLHGAGVSAPAGFGAGALGQARFPSLGVPPGSALDFRPDAPEDALALPDGGADRVGEPGVGEQRWCVGTLARSHVCTL